jgi:Tfp pilus assembly protein PilW
VSDWVSARATITACELRRPEGVSVEDYCPPLYLVTFSYSADSQTFKGTYRTNSEQECGHEFEILYNPKHPSRNTGSDGLTQSWATMTGFVLVVIAILAGLWLFVKLGWEPGFR